MRVPVGRPLRVGPGDAITVRGQLPDNAKLGRLYVFAREGDGQYSPYVQNVSEIIGGQPHMFTPMSFRLNSERREYQMSFIADIDGVIRIMQEVDTASDPRVRIKIKRTICASLGWKQWLVRWMRGIFSWPMLLKLS